jgi:hypothetical protein
VKASSRTIPILWALVAALVVTNVITVIALAWQGSQNHQMRQRLPVASKVVPAIPAAKRAEARQVHEAVQKDQVERLKELLDEHPDLLHARPYPSGSTPLHAAAFYGRDAAVNELLARKAAVNAQNVSGLTPLHDCVHRGTVESAALLLDHQGDPSIRNNAGQTPLAYALEKNRPDMVELLQQRGVKE